MTSKKKYPEASIASLWKYQRRKGSPERFAGWERIDKGDPQSLVTLGKRLAREAQKKFSGVEMEYAVSTSHPANLGPNDTLFWSKKLDLKPASQQKAKRLTADDVIKGEY